jgi:large subunit ribosomal protein L17
MKHRVKGSQLNRDSQHRTSLRRNLIASLIEHGQITTSLAKAKAIQPDVDKLVTKAKSGSVHDQRQIHSYVQERSLVSKLVSDIAPKQKRSSGFTRIRKTERRQGDDMQLAIISWTDEVKEPLKGEVKKLDSKKTATTDVKKTTSKKITKPKKSDKATKVKK